MLYTHPATCGAEHVALITKALSRRTDKASKRKTKSYTNNPKIEE
jgi:hypothetical protein